MLSDQIKYKEDGELSSSNEIRGITSYRSGLSPTQRLESKNGSEGELRKTAPEEEGERKELRFVAGDVREWWAASGDFISILNGLRRKGEERPAEYNPDHSGRKSKRFEGYYNFDGDVTAEAIVGKEQKVTFSEISIISDQIITGGVVVQGLGESVEGFSYWDASWDEVVVHDLVNTNPGPKISPRGLVEFGLNESGYRDAVKDVFASLSDGWGWEELFEVEESLREIREDLEGVDSSEFLGALLERVEDRKAELVDVRYEERNEKSKFESLSPDISSEKIEVYLDEEM